MYIIYYLHLRCKKYDPVRTHVIKSWQVKLYRVVKVQALLSLYRRHGLLKVYL